MDKEIKSISYEMWKELMPFHMPVLVPEGLIKTFVSKGAVSKEEYELLQKDLVVLVAGFWIVMTKYISAKF